MAEDVKVPEGWRKIPLLENLAFIKGKAPRKFYNFKEKNTIRYLTPEYLRGRNHETLYCNIYEAEIVNDDVVVLWDGSNAGEIFFAKDGAIASTMAKIEIDEKSHKRFFYYYLKLYEPILKYQIKGSGIPHVEKDIFGLLPNTFPPLPEQRKIAEILETIDNAIEKTDRIIEKYKRIKQGLMQDLFTKGITAFGFEKDKLINAVKKAFKNGDHNFGRDENLINHLSDYLREVFSEWDVDSEIEKNKERHRPDIIIHKRRNLNENLFAIEVKKSENLNRIKEDIKKLEDLMLKEYRYQDAVFIGFNIENFDGIFELSEKVNFVLISKDGEVKIRNRVRRFKDSPLGRIPEEWEVVEFYDLFEVIDNRGRTPPFSEEGSIPYLSAENIKGGKILYHFENFVTEETYRRYIRGSPTQDHILFTTEAPLGEVALAPKIKFCFAQRVIAMQPKKGDSKYYLYLIQHELIQRQLNNLLSGTTVKGISAKNLKKVNFIAPPLPEQHRIASILSQIDEAIEKEQKYKEKLERIKRGLMEDLLTGKVRVLGVKNYELGVKNYEL